MVKGKYVFLFFVLLYICSFFGVYALSIDPVSISIKEKSSSISVTDPVIENHNISTNISFNKLNDYVIFTLVLKNSNDVKCKINRVIDNNTSNSLLLEYTYGDTYIDVGGNFPVEIKMTYKEEPSGGDTINLDSLNIDFEFVDESNEVIGNPKTNDAILDYCALLVLTFIGMFVTARVIRKERILMVILAMAIFIPVVINASSSPFFRITFKNIQVVVNALDHNYVTYNGNLSVNGRNLVNKKGNPIALRGMSVGNSINLDEKYANSESFAALKAWGTNVVRLPINVVTNNSNHGYADYKEELMPKLFNLIDACIDLDMYAIVDWHVLSEKNPLLNKDYAIEFFTAVATAYKDYPNVIYEIANEPYSAWQDMVDYSNEIIPIIRAIDPDSLILVGGVNGSDTDITLIDYENIMFVPHIYFFSGDSINKILSYIENDIPIFVTEFGTTTSVDWSLPDPAAPVYFAADYSDRLMYFFNRYNISWTNWSIGDGDGYPIVKKKQWDNALADDILSPNGAYIKSIVSGTKSLDYLNDVPVMKNYKEGEAFWTEDYRNTIVKVAFQNTLDMTRVNNAVAHWDMTSIMSNKKVYAYVEVNEDDAEKYNLYIAADGIINPYFSTSKMFKDFKKVKEIDLTYLSTYGVNDMSYMFDACKELSNLVLGDYFNMNNVTTIMFMFRDCYKISQIDFSKFVMPMVGSCLGAFQRTYLLEYIDFSNVTSARLFNYSSAFAGITNLKRLDISSAIIGSKYNYDGTLNNIANNFGTLEIIVKDAEAKAYFEEKLETSGRLNYYVYTKDEVPVYESFVNAFNSGEYDWSDLHAIAKDIASNFGLEKGKVNKLTSRVTFTYDNRLFKIEIGDIFNLKDTDDETYKVRVLGFNTDKQADASKLDSEYTYDSEYAGISFEFLNQLWYLNTSDNTRWSVMKMNPTSTNAGGWGVSAIREHLNSTAGVGILQNQDYIKTVKKEYNLGNAETYNAETPSEDQLWLLASSEIYPEKVETIDEVDITLWGYTLSNESTMTEGIDETRYAYYKLNNISANKRAEILKRPKTTEESPSRSWWLRSPNYGSTENFNNIVLYQWYLYSTGSNANTLQGIVPGFCI